MKKSKDYSWLLYAIILTIAILASSCGESTKSINYTVDVRDTTVTKYPYEWDSVNYNRIICIVNGEPTSHYYQMTVYFNEEFIEIVCPNSIEDGSIIFMGKWTDKCTFIIDNKDTATINHKTGFMSICYNSGTKEIYTH